VHEFGVVLGDGAERGVFFDVHEQLLARANVMRVGQPRDLHGGRQRLLGVRDGGCVPGSAPELHRHGGVGCVHLQHELDVPYGGIHVRELFERRGLRTGFVRLLLRVNDIGLLRHYAGVSGRNVCRVQPRH